MAAITKTWTAFADAAVDLDSPVNELLMTGFRDNMIYLREWLGASYTAGAVQDHDHDGANSKVIAVTEAMLGSSIVSQGKLKSTTASGNTAIDAGVDTTVALTGGTYAWWTASNLQNAVGIAFGGNTDTAAGTIGIKNVGGSNGTFSRDERYIQASPPYRLGPCFVFLCIEPGGAIRHIEVANDPPWAYHGPTDIAATYYENGKAFKRITLIDGIPIGQAMKNRAAMQKIVAGQAQITQQIIEITEAYKDSDIGVIPHPWANPNGADVSGATIVLLEPGTKIMQAFADACDAGEAREIKNLIVEDYINIGNVDLGVPDSPPGVIVARAQWKLTP